MLADRIRAFGIVGASLLGIVAAVAMVADTRDEVVAARVTVVTVEFVGTPIREAQYVVAPLRTVDCRYPVRRWGSNKSAHKDPLLVY